MNPYDKSLDQTRDTEVIRLHQNPEDVRAITRMLDRLDAKDMVHRFTSFEELTDAATDIGFFNGDALKDYLRDQEMILPKAGPRICYFIAIVRPGTKVLGHPVPANTYSIFNTSPNDPHGFVFIAFCAPTWEHYRRIVEFTRRTTTGVLMMTEADMEQVREHMHECPDFLKCPTYMTQMAVNASIEMMAIAAGGRS